ncbi:hypothetical protein, partial [uncultured Corynebacterium sp.]|uniref:hypothetical protein n=1 Tax=uncultured Corynebacterium sp. TaxID=159447 RepID=UPI002599D2C6
RRHHYGVAPGCGYVVAGGHGGAGAHRGCRYHCSAADPTFPRERKKIVEWEDMLGHSTHKREG